MKEMSIDMRLIGEWINSGADGNVRHYGDKMVIKQFDSKERYSAEKSMYESLYGFDGVARCYGYNDSGLVLFLEYHSATLSKHMYCEWFDEKRVDKLLSNIYNIIEPIINSNILPMDVHINNIMYDKETESVTLIDLARYERDFVSFDSDNSLKFLNTLHYNDLIEYDEYREWCQKFDRIIIPKIQENERLLVWK